MTPFALRTTLWGTRGSLPAPGPATLRYGGNTPCVEVLAGDGGRFVLDAGTGARPLGIRMRKEGNSGHVQLLLTHFHLDHIHGLPFFAPLRDPETAVTIYAPATDDDEVESWLAIQSGSPYFPVELGQHQARIEFRALSGNTWTHGGTEIAWIPVRHADGAVGYRLVHGGRSVAYVPDNELSGRGYGLGPGWDADFRRFLAGVDLLIHDGMYTPAELEARRGWGHTAMDEVVRFAVESGVGRLLLFHHEPDRTDDELAGAEEELRELAMREGSDLELGFAAEGEVVELAPAAHYLGA